MPPNELPERQTTPPASATPADHTQRLISTYLRTLTSPATIKTYNTEIRAIVNHLCEKGIPLAEITPEDLSVYREYVVSTYSSATSAKKLAVARRFLTFTHMAGVTVPGPEVLKFFAKSPKVNQDPSYNVLNKEELSRMLSAAYRESSRDYLMISVMAGCGLREGEVVEIRLGDFQELEEEQVLLRVRGKGNKIRNVPISPALWHTVQRYITSSGRSLTSNPDTRKPLFCSRVGTDKPLTTRSIQNIIKKYVRAAGITKPISPHSIRHTVGTNMAMNEAPLLVIQQFLGHSDPKTTLRYVRRAEELAAKAYTYNTLTS
ncbi:MAG: tyrosine-type recombinase/integrase [Rubrobacter sp.]|jgi:site-specific recombinase XerD|nr:tyrosine-type recombinase/integrase [Rubrobacter sp.]